MPSFSQRLLRRLAFVYSARSRFDAAQQLIKRKLEEFPDLPRAEQRESRNRKYASRAYLIKRTGLQNYLDLNRVRSAPEQRYSLQKMLDADKAYLIKRPPSQQRVFDLIRLKLDAQKLNDAYAQKLNDAFRADSIKRPPILGKLLDSRGGGVRSSGFRDIICWNCQKRGHTSRKCKGPFMMCHKCGGWGHLADECRWGSITDWFARRNR